MGPAASLAREKGDRAGTGWTERDVLCGVVSRIREVLEAQREPTGPSGGPSSERGGLPIALV